MSASLLIYILTSFQYVYRANKLTQKHGKQYIIVMYIRTLNSCSILVELGVETMCELLWYASFCIYAIMIPTRRAGYTQSGKNEWWTKTYKSF